MNADTTSDAISRTSPFDISDSTILIGVTLTDGNQTAAWRNTIRDKLMKGTAKNLNLIDQIRDNLGFTIDEFMTALEETGAFRKLFLQPQNDAQGN